MGSHYSVYIGSYIKVKPRMETVVREHSSCLNEKCRNHGVELNSKFCPRCGSAIGKKEFSSEEKVILDVYDFCDKHFGDGSMFAFFHEYIIGNYSIDGFYCSRDFEFSLNKIDNEITPNWKRFLNKLEEKGYEYEYHFGVLGGYV